MSERFHPGVFLKEAIENRGLTVEGFAEMCSLPIEYVEPIVNCKASIDSVDAVIFGQVLGTSAEVWTNLQRSYWEACK